MNSQINQILKLNMQFYQSVSKDFSNTRKSAWKGWEKAVDIYLNTANRDRGVNRVLDLGCGNGRFADYIKGRVKNYSYKGYDTNNDLLSQAKRKYKGSGNENIKFVNKDIINKLDTIESKFDLVVCFGITHHLPDNNFRMKWFKNLTKLVKKNGIVIITFWDFDKKPGDYLIGWDNNNIARYCHKYSNKELKVIRDLFESKSFSILSNYESDNKNKYYIFGKI